MNTQKHVYTLLTQGEFVDELLDQRVDLHKGNTEMAEQMDPEASLRKTRPLLQQGQNLTKSLMP